MLNVVKGQGLIGEALSIKELKLVGESRLAIGHTRYSTAGEKNAVKNLQPFLAEYLTGRLAAAHNGNLTNADALKSFLVKRGLEFKASSDSTPRLLQGEFASAEYTARYTPTKMPLPQSRR